MSQPKKIGSLEIDEDIGFQQKEWTVERASWVVFVILIILGALGLFGGGPLSTASRGNPGGIQITYERFDRQKKSSQFLIQLPPSSINNGQITFWIDKNFIDSFEIAHISPVPQRVAISSSQVIYTISVADSVAESEQPVTVKIDIRTAKSGLIHGRAGLENGDSISFSQLVYP